MKKYQVQIARTETTVYYIDVMAEDEYEAIGIVKEDIVGVSIENVFLQLNGKWNRDE